MYTHIYIYICQLLSSLDQVTYLRKARLYSRDRIYIPLATGVDYGKLHIPYKKPVTCMHLYTAEAKLLLHTICPEL